MHILMTSCLRTCLADEGEVLCPTLFHSKDQGDDVRTLSGLLLQTYLGLVDLY
jgi:hypothetical protein